MALPGVRIRTDKFNPYSVSASRVNSYLKCGVAFHKEYVELIPQQRSGSAALFGNVLHRSLEKWALDRSQNLVHLTALAWSELTQDTKLWDFLAAYRPLSVRARRLEDEILARRPEIKAVRMTKDWKQSAAAAEIAQLVSDWLPKLQDSPWLFTERDPLPAKFDQSLRVARKYQERYRNHPRALYTEYSFSVPFNEFTLNGYIDAIEPKLREGELLAYRIVDYKTYAEQGPVRKDWRQMIFYYVAFTTWLQEGFFPELSRDVPIECGVDYVVAGGRRFWRITERDVDALYADLKMYATATEGGVFLPAEKGAKPDYCPYPEDCCLTRQAEGCFEPLEEE